MTQNAAPNLCLHGTADEYVAYEQATWIVDKLKAATVEAELVGFEGAGHGLKGVPLKKPRSSCSPFSTDISSLRQ